MDVDAAQDGTETTVIAKVRRDGVIEVLKVLTIKPANTGGETRRKPEGDA